MLAVALRIPPAVRTVIADVIPITDRGLLQASAELDWYFNSSEGAMGLRSTFYALLFATGGAVSYEVPEHALEAAERERHIRRTLARLEPFWRLVLHCRFGTSSRELQAFGELGSVAALTPAARSTYWRTPSGGTVVTLASARLRRAVGVVHPRKPKPPFIEWLRRLSGRVTTEESHNLAADRALVRRISYEASELLVEALSAYDLARGRRR